MTKLWTPAARAVAARDRKQSKNSSVCACTRIILRIIVIPFIRSTPNDFGQAIEYDRISYSLTKRYSPLKGRRWSQPRMFHSLITEAPHSLAEVIEERHKFFVTILSQF